MHLFGFHVFFLFFFCFFFLFFFFLFFVFVFFFFFFGGGGFDVNDVQGLLPVFVFKIRYKTYIPQM